MNESSIAQRCSEIIIFKNEITFSSALRYILCSLGIHFSQSFSKFQVYYLVLSFIMLMTGEVMITFQSVS